MYRIPNGFRDDKTDTRTVGHIRIPVCVHDQIGLHRPHPLTYRGTEFGRSRHPVPRRKHRAGS
jgi:hypothetical protein